MTGFAVKQPLEISGHAIRTMWLVVTALAIAALLAGSFVIGRVTANSSSGGHTNTGGPAVVQVAPAAPAAPFAGAVKCHIYEWC